MVFFMKLEILLYVSYYFCFFFVLGMVVLIDVGIFCFIKIVFLWFFIYWSIMERMIKFVKIKSSKYLIYVGYGVVWWIVLRYIFCNFNIEIGILWYIIIVI